jgi:Glycosyl transferase family 2
MANVVCVMMQKNEAELLTPWIKYHGWLFGLHNLVIVDNGSSDAHVLQLLDHYEKLGCSVIRQFSDKYHFELKGEVIKTIINSIDRAVDYDFIFPLDCDEFIAYSGSDISTSREVIHSYLDSIKGTKATIVIDRILLNVPREPGFFVPQEIKKVLFEKNTCLYVDRGYHGAMSCHHPSTFTPDLAYFHFHNRPFSRILFFSEQKIGHRVNTADQDALRLYRGDGVHVKQHYFETEKSYNDRYDKQPTVLCYDLIERFISLEIDIEAIFGSDIIGLLPVKPDIGRIIRVPLENGNGYALETFEPELYLDLNPDVRAAGVWGIRHYTSFGYREGRTINRGRDPVLIERRDLAQPKHASPLNTSKGNHRMNFANV